MKLLIGILVFQIITFANSELQCNGENEALRSPTLQCPCPCACPPNVICNSFINKTTCQCINNTFRDPISQKCVKEVINCPFIPYCNHTNEAAVYPTPDCPATCQNRGYFRCATVTNSTTCQCVNNTIRDTVSGNCVNPDDCPPQCNHTNEAPVSPTPGCPPTCQNRGQDLCLVLIDETTCQCVNNTIRDEYTGKCVCRDDCPDLTCNGDNEVPKYPTPVCPATCQNRRDFRCATLSNTTTCQCADGYIRDTISDNCVPPDYCPVVCNGQNEAPKSPTPVCPITCQNRDGVRCEAISNTTTCQCINCTIRDTVSGNCVTPDDCP